jgi:hypothetical protein
MSPESLEQGFPNTEGQQQKQEKKYLDIERGDAFSVNNSANQNNQHQNSAQNNQKSQAQQKAVDPIEIVNSMISAGFTPTRSQISNAQANLAGSKESSNTWFAMLLQRLVKQKKIKDAKKKK